MKLSKEGKIRQQQNVIMKQESLNKATELVINVIQNSDINVVDKLELLININTFLEHYHEAIKQRFGSKFDKPKGLRKENNGNRHQRTRR